MRSPDTDEERCPVEGCDELPEDHYHPAPQALDALHTCGYYKSEHESDGGMGAICPAGASLDVGRLKRALWNLPNDAERWLAAESDTSAFAEAIAAEYARLASEPTDDAA